MMVVLESRSKWLGELRLEESTRRVEMLGQNNYMNG